MSRPANPLTIAKRTDGYWIRDVTGEILGVPCGPYETIAEAHSDARGLWRTRLYEIRMGFWTDEEPDKPQQPQRQLMAF